MSANNGGPAFPQNRPYTPYNTDFDGISLLDWFAGQALATMSQTGELKKRWRSYGAYNSFDLFTTSLEARPTEFGQNDKSKCKYEGSDPEDMAFKAYAIASAMLAEKAKREKEQ